MTAVLLLNAKAFSDIFKVIRPERRECRKLSDVRQEKGSALLKNPKNSSSQCRRKEGDSIYEKWFSLK
jgi:hypothetical protein